MIIRQPPTLSQESQKIYDLFEDEDIMPDNLLQWAYYKIRVKKGALNHWFGRDKSFWERMPLEKKLLTYHYYTAKQKGKAPFLIEELRRLDAIPNP